MSMKSPFPGMDPYLEQHWRDVHTSLMVYLRDQIDEQLPADLSARVEEGVFVDTEDGKGRGVAPDVTIAERSGTWSMSAAAVVDRTSSALAEAMIVPVEPLPQRHVEIFDLTAGGRVVTAIEVLSPTNKSEGRAAYRKKQSEYLASAVNLVEIDLLREGTFTLAVPLDRIHPKLRSPYMACIRRVTNPSEAEVYRIALTEKLPTIPIPLRPTDRDVTLNLQALIEQCYQRGRYGSIDYQVEPQPAVSADQQAWMDRLLREQGRRK